MPLGVPEGQWHSLGRSLRVVLFFTSVSHYKFYLFQEKSRGIHFLLDLLTELSESRLDEFLRDPTENYV